jgi:hypothetical protein
MDVGFTGARIGMNDRQRRTLYRLLRRFTGGRLHHGDCVGADEQAHQFARRQQMLVVLHPPDQVGKRAFCRADEIRPAQPYLDRNHAIVDESEVLIAAPATSRELLRSGTWATVRYARKAGREILLLLPNGSVLTIPRRLTRGNGPG